VLSPVLLLLMPKDISELPKDLTALVDEIRREAASNIHFSIQHKSPWWTGSFNTAWVIDTSPIRQYKERKLNIPWNKVKPKRKPPKRMISPAGVRGKSIFIGNEMEYADFVLAHGTIAGISYLQHGQRYQLTGRPAVYNWFQIYMKSKLLISDIDRAFYTNPYFSVKG